jgi:hypothetical protein
MSVAGDPVIEKILLQFKAGCRQLPVKLGKYSSFMAKGVQSHGTAALLFNCAG